MKRSNGNRPRILNLEPADYSNEAKGILESLGDVVEGPFNRSALLDRVGSYDVLIVRLGHQIDAEVLDHADCLTTIVTATTGLNHIDLEEAYRRGISVLSLRGEREFLDGIYATAEHTWALVLSLFRHLPAAHTHVTNNSWERDLFKGTELHGKCIGIVGFGRIGTKVARYGVAFGMRVLVNDPKFSHGVSEIAEHVCLNRLLSEADIVSLHVHYDETTHKLIGEKELRAMKPGAVLVNTARGEVISEDALLSCLSDGHLGGAALDVLTGENDGWTSSKRLIEYAKSYSNLVITPHIGGCTEESMEKTEIFMAKKLIEHYRTRGRA